MSSVDSPTASRGGLTGSSTTPPESSQRRERAAIAAQACETCRTRKSKCDELRPKCSLCTRLNVECHYREPQPTKKDKTLDYLLQLVSKLNKNVEGIDGKLDRIDRKLPDPGRQLAGSKDFLTSSDRSFQGGAVSQSEMDDSASYPHLQKSYQHLTAPHKVLLWPAVYLHQVALGLEAAVDLQYVLQEGTAWLLRQELKRHPTPLPTTPTLIPTRDAMLVEGDVIKKIPSFSYDLMSKYADYYFNTFNVLYPLLDREDFMEETLPESFRNGFKEDEPLSTVALSVFALGKVAQEGTWGEPIYQTNGFRSGLRGGTEDIPPALDLFNEARRRMGFISTQCSLENVQALLLQAIYYEASARHLDFWRSEIAASTACQVLIKCDPIDFDSPKGGLIKRAFWICNLMENWYHCDLDLPLTGIGSLEKHVPLPGQGSDSANSESQYVQLQFLALIAIRRLVSSIHTTIYEATVSPLEIQEEWGGPSIHVIRELARQLDSWRALLPTGLQWSDGDRFGYPDLGPLGHRQPGEPLFALQSRNTPVEQMHSLYMLTAQLRSRYYYARFMIYRPFVFKALHSPEAMNSDEMRMAAMCLQSALLWPIAMAPPRERKRIVPYLFAWTQHFMGILLILRMTTENPVLLRITEDHLDTGEIEQTVVLLLDWIKDMKQICGIASWSWSILEPLFRDVLDPKSRS